MNRQLTAWRELQSRVLSVEQIRQVDRRAVEAYAMHPLVLMENAALACTDWLRRRWDQPQTTTILCGRGNNGGDGLAIARHLTNCGWPITVLQLGPIDQLSADAQANYRILTAGAGMPICVLESPLDPRAREQIAASQVIIDALLGTGARGAPRPPLDDWLQAANDAPGFRVAIDIPTGVDAETGHTAGVYFHAGATLSFVARKPAMALDAAAARFGELAILPIGIPAALIVEILEASEGQPSSGGVGGS